MPVAARCNPADHPTLVPDGFIAEYVGIGSIDHHADAAPLAAGLFFMPRCFRADERAFAKVHEALESCFEGTIDGAQLTIPSREVLLETQRQQRAHAKVGDALFEAGGHDLGV